MNRMVAVKILHPKLANRKDLVSRFRREARAMSHLTHPNTVKVLLYGELDDGSLYIVMEYLEGKNLNQTVRTEGPLAVERALPILIQVCGALEEAHRAGHRPPRSQAREHLPLPRRAGSRDFPKVLDFGLAKVTEREMRPGSIILTQEGMVFGTPEFMSPEQAQGKTLDAGERHLLARGHSLRGAHRQAAVRRAHADGVHPAPRDDAADPARTSACPARRFPPGLGEVIAKALDEEARGSLPVGRRVRGGAEAVRRHGRQGLQRDDARSPVRPQSGAERARAGEALHGSVAKGARSRASGSSSGSPPRVSGDGRRPGRRGDAASCADALALPTLFLGTEAVRRPGVLSLGSASPESR